MSNYTIAKYTFVNGTNILPNTTPSLANQTYSLSGLNLSGGYQWKTVCNIGSPDNFVSSDTTRENDTLSLSDYTKNSDGSYSATVGTDYSIKIAADGTVSIRIEGPQAEDLTVTVTAKGIGEYSDITNSDGTITRTITGSSLPTQMNFANKTRLIEVHELNTSNLTDMSNMFYGCSSLTSVNLSNCTINSSINTTNMFKNCFNLSNVTIDNSDYISVNKIIEQLPDNLSDSTITFNISNIDNIEQVDIVTAQNKGWTIPEQGSNQEYTETRITLTEVLESIDLPNGEPSDNAELLCEIEYSNGSKEIKELLDSYYEVDGIMHHDYYYNLSDGFYYLVVDNTNETNTWRVFIDYGGMEDNPPLPGDMVSVTLIIREPVSDADSNDWTIINTQNGYWDYSGFVDDDYYLATDFIDISDGSNVYIKVDLKNGTSLNDYYIVATTTFDDEQNPVNLGYIAKLISIGELLIHDPDVWSQFGFSIKYINVIICRSDSETLSPNDVVVTYRKENADKNISIKLTDLELVTYEGNGPSSASDITAFWKPYDQAGIILLTFRGSNETKTYKAQLQDTSGNELTYEIIVEWDGSAWRVFVDDWFGNGFPGESIVVSIASHESERHLVTQYKFDNSIHGDLIPEFNEEFTEYEVVDDNIEENITTRSIYSTELPTMLRFCERHEFDPRPESLLEVMHINTNNITDMSYMFAQCVRLTSINFDGSNLDNVLNMTSMFAYNYELVNISMRNCSISSINKIIEQIKHKYELLSDGSEEFFYRRTISISNYSDELNIDRLAEKQWMLYSDEKNDYVEIYTAAIFKFNSEIDTRSYVLLDFNGTYNDCAIYDVDNGDGTITRTTKTISAPYYISIVDAETMDTPLGLLEIHYINYSGFLSSNYEYIGPNLTKVILGDIDTINNALINWFDTMLIFNSPSLTEIVGINELDTSRIYYFYETFLGCSALEELDLSNWDTTYAEDVDSMVVRMFSGCTNLKTLDISNFNILAEYVTDNFVGCDNLTTVKMLNCPEDTVNIIVAQLPDRTGKSKGTIYVKNVTGNMNSTGATSKNWTIEKVELSGTSGALILGNLAINNLYLGSLPVIKAYLGNILVYQQAVIEEIKKVLLAEYTVNSEVIAIPTIQKMKTGSTTTETTVRVLQNTYIEVEAESFDDFIAIKYDSGTEVADPSYSIFDYNNDIYRLTANGMHFVIIERVSGNSWTIYGYVADSGGYANLEEDKGISLTATGNDMDINDMGIYVTYRSAASSLVNVDIETQTINNGNGTTTIKIYTDEENAYPNKINFSGMTTLSSIQYLMSEEITNADHMFANCTGLVTLNIENINTNKIINADYMFAGCTSLTSLYAGESTGEAHTIRSILGDTGGAESYVAFTINNAEEAREICSKIKFTNANGELVSFDTPRIYYDDEYSGGYQIYEAIDYGITYTRDSVTYNVCIVYEAEGNSAYVGFSYPGFYNAETTIIIGDYNVFELPNVVTAIGIFDGCYSLTKI